MLHLRSSNGFQNIFSLEVLSSTYANTIGTNSSNVNTSKNTQWNPQSNRDYSSNPYYHIKLINQLTQKTYFSELGVQNNFTGKFPRSNQFFIYLDDYVGDYHININSNGLYDYEVYVSEYSSTTITSEKDSAIIRLVNNGIALVQNDNFKNDYYQNSENGVTPLVIPNAKAYNG